MNWSPGEQRQLLILRDLNVSLDDMARYLDRSKPAVKAMLHELRDTEYRDLIACAHCSGSVAVPFLGRMA